MESYVVQSWAFPQTYSQIPVELECHRLHAFLSVFGLQLLKPGFRLTVMHESLFFRLEFGGVHDDSRIMNSRMMLHMQHLVEHHVFGHVMGDIRGIENPADEDRIVRGVEAAQNVA